MMTAMGAASGLAMASPTATGRLNGRNTISVIVGEMSATVR
jgi:hypothetical protein